MPMIYVHGVRHREPEKLRRMKDKLTALLRELHNAVPSLPSELAVNVPYWGEFGVRPQFQGLLPFDAPVQEIDLGAESSEQNGGVSSLEILREASDDDATAMRALLLQELGKMSVTSAERDSLEALLAGDWEDLYLREQATRASHATTCDAHEGLERRDDEAPPDLIRERTPLQRLVDLVERTASQLLMDQGWAQRWVRTFQENCALFMGDAMAYVIQREALGARGPILETVLKAFPPPGAAAEPLIVMTHSMGAAIVHDIISKFRTDLTVDCWISVGSQVGLFASLGLLADQAQAPRGKRLDALQGRVRYWRNIFDRYDFLNYLTEPAFTYVRDREYANARGPAASHSWYFKEQPFWDRVSGLLKEALTGAPA